MGGKSVGVVANGERPRGGELPQRKRNRRASSSQDESGYGS